MWADAWLLMRLYWKIDGREAAGASRWRVIGLIAAALGILAMAVFSGFVGYGLSFLLRPESPVELGRGVVPGLFLTFVLLGALMAGLNQAVRSLYLSGDLDRLMVAPIHTRSIMIAKLLSRMPTTMLILFLATAPAWVTYGIGIGAGPIYYVLGILLLLLAPLFGLGVGAIIAMLLVRLLPPNRLNEMLAAAYAVLGIMIALLAQLPRFLFSDEDSSTATLNSAGQLVSRLDEWPIPTLLAGRGLLALDAFQFDGLGLLGLLFYVLITAGLFLAVVTFGQRTYLSGWLRTQAAGGKRRGLEERDGVFGGRSLSFALGVKDWLMRIRDPRQLVSLLSSGIIAIVVGALAIFRGQGGEESLLAASQAGMIQAEGPLAALTAAFQPGVLMSAWALFAAYVMLSNTALYALALEGGSFSLLKAAPLRPRDVWNAKLWSTLIPTVVVFVIVLGLSRIIVPFSLAWLPYSLLAGIVLLIGLTMTNISAGFRFANLGWADPRKMTTSGGGLISFLLSIAYGVPATLLALAPFSLSHLWPQWSLLLAVAGLVVLALGTWLWRVLMTRWADRSWYLLPA